MAQRFLFTSESVTEGHPDKMCDIISDTVLDECLRQDPTSHVACETATKTGFVLVFGEITSKAKLDYQKLVRNAVEKIGYTSSKVCFDSKTCNVMVSGDEQSPDIAQAVHENKSVEELGAAQMERHKSPLKTKEMESTSNQFVSIQFLFQLNILTISLLMNFARKSRRMLLIQFYQLILLIQTQSITSTQVDVSSLVDLLVMLA